ncbi:MAG TPA: hypothetical protein VF074_15635 [Pyrinomonadaceae bacterium]
MVRHWLLGNKPGAEEQIFDIEHIQTGRRTRVSSLDKAQGWLEAVSVESRLREQSEAEQQRTAIE